MKRAALILVLLLLSAFIACVEDSTTPQPGIALPDSGISLADATADTAPAPLDSCAQGNGGCDSLTTCTNHPGATPTCGPCPADYVGDGLAGCTPTLSGLATSIGTVSPTLAATVTAYRVNLKLTDQTITITPTVPVGATLTVNGQAQTTGQPWTSPVLNLGDNTINLVASHAGHSTAYVLTVARGHQEAYIKASNTPATAPPVPDAGGPSPNDTFGDCIAIDGDTLVVGAPVEGSNATGVNGNQADDSAPGSGAVYVFVRSGTTWSQQAYLKASNTQAGDNFGYGVAISGDTIVVGANREDSNAKGVGGDQTNNSTPDTGAAYVFTRTGTTWTQQAYLKASNTVGGAAFPAEFGKSVGIAGDTIVVTAFFEASNSPGVNGVETDVSMPGAGAAYVFTRTGTAWSQQAYLKASHPHTSDNFGWRTAIAGNTIVVGAWGDDSNATGVNGDDTNALSTDSGSAYVFVRNGTIWTQQAYLKQSNTNPADDFGHSVAISNDTIVIGASQESSSATGVNGDQTNNAAQYSGAAYVYTRTGTIWTQQAYLKPSNTAANQFFGWSAAIVGDTIVVGAPYEASNATGLQGNQADTSAVESGAFYTFTRTGTVWSPGAYVKASNTGAGDYFGARLAMSADTIVTAAYFEASNATGINGNQSDNSSTRSGAVYVFR